MPQPELKPDDVFHVVGFTYRDVLSGVELQLIQLFETPAHPSETRLVELYSIRLFSAPDIAAFTQYGHFLAVYFYSETAIELSKDFGLRLPPVIAKITRAEIPLWAIISVRMPYPAKVRTRGASELTEPQKRRSPLRPSHVLHAPRPGSATISPAHAARPSRR